MNFSLENFGAGFKSGDLVLYAGVVLVVYILFKEKIHALLSQIQNKLKAVKTPELPSIDTGFFDRPEPTTQDDMFFELIKSWKKTRDLAESCDLTKAVEVADQMFPYLSPRDASHEEE